MNVVGLHGFWGSPAEFDGFIEALGAENSWVPNLFEPGPLDPTHRFDVWTKNFLKLLHTHFGDEPVQLVGYSQGGRLALHAALREPERFQHVWLLSANPGQLSDEAKVQRQIWIEQWTQKFAHDDWSKLLQDWNAQDVFAGSEMAAKSEPPRQFLIQALKNWSLLEHQFNWDDLRTLKAPVTWVFGALDKKFLAVKASLQRQDVTGEFWVVDGAGHRLLADAPGILAQRLKERENHGG